MHLDQPLPVLVDLGAFYPLPVFHDEPRVEGGLRLHQVVEDRLTMWALFEDGQWPGFVAYDVGRTAEGGLP